MVSASHDWKTDATAAVKAALITELVLYRAAAFISAVLLSTAWAMNRKLPVMMADSTKVMFKIRLMAALSLLSETSY